LLSVKHTAKIILSTPYILHKSVDKQIPPKPESTIDDHNQKRICIVHHYKPS
jgi:hypothetical protein